MKYSEFRERVALLPYFRSNIFRHLTHQPQVLRRQIVDWQNKGYLLPIKRGIYTLRAEDRRVTVSPFALASVIQPVSYISLETALSYYQMIPERVGTIISVTPKKTQSFDNAFGHYQYHHLQKAAYMGFVSLHDEGQNPFLIATPEKALLDFFYFRMRGVSHFDESLFEQSFRLQNVESLEQEKLLSLAAHFQQNKLNTLLDLFFKWRHHA